MDDRLVNRMKPDALSGWATAPAAARLAGDGEVFRFFESPEEAMAFIAEPARNAARQRRLRQRRRENAMVVRWLTVPAVVVDALIKSGRLSEKAARDPEQVGRELVAVGVEWFAREWSGNFP